MTVYNNGRKIKDIYHFGRKVKEAYSFGALVYQIKKSVNYSVSDTGISFGPGFFRPVVNIDYPPTGEPPTVTKTSEPFDKQVDIPRLDSSGEDFTSKLVEEEYDTGKSVTVKAGSTTTTLTSGGSAVTTKQVWANSSQNFFGKHIQSMSVSFTTNKDAYFTFNFQFPSFQYGNFLHTGPITITGGGATIWESSSVSGTASRYETIGGLQLLTGTTYSIKWQFETTNAQANMISDGHWKISAGCRFSPIYTYHYNKPMSLYAQTTRRNYLNEDGSIAFTDEQTQMGLYPEGEVPTTYYEPEPLGVFYIDEEGLITQYEMLA